MKEDELPPFHFPIEDKSEKIIKVIGVGGGGGNAVQHMYEEGVKNVSFLVTNTDSQVLKVNMVPSKIQLGDGLGTGGDPKKGREIAENNIDTIKTMFGEDTHMVFITAGMGGGTGTGAAPVIARVAKEMGILTVGVVTLPFKMEMRKRMDKALLGMEDLKKCVDSLIVINNQRLLESERFKQLTGLDEPVIEFLEEDGEILRFLENVYALVDAHVERFLERGFMHLQVSFGCTGGQHRSAYSAQHLAEHLVAKYPVKVHLIHRERGIETWL